jgi:hypothetical protein
MELPAVVWRRRRLYAANAAKRNLNPAWLVPAPVNWQGTIG